MSTPVNYKRSIHTDCFTPKTAEILKRAKLYMRTCWGSTQMTRNARLADVNYAPNGEVLWEVRSELTNTRNWRTIYYGNSTYATRTEDWKVREWLCMVLKRICFNQFESHKYGEPKPTAKEIHKRWNRNNDEVVKWLSENVKHPDNKDASGNYEMVVNEFGDITVAQVYCLYEKLLNRKRFNKTYSKSMKALIIGEEKDPAATQLEIIRREELIELEAKHKEDVKALEAERSAEIERTCEEIRAHYRQMIADNTAAYEKRKKELNDSLSFMKDVDPVAAMLMA